MKKWTVLKVGLVSAIMITTPVSAVYQPVQSRTSSDRYTDYIKDYVGTNLASFGYTALDGKRRDQYGNGIVEIIFETDSGVYIDPEDEEQLKKYVVVDQSIDPDTEIKMEYEKQENGIRGSITLPAGMTGTFLYPDGSSFSLVAGENRIG